MKFKLFSITLLILLLNLYSTYNAQNDYLVENWHYIGLNSTMGEKVLVSTDLDNDGSEEIILDFKDGKFLAVMEYYDGDYYYKWLSQLFEDPIKDVVLLDANNDSAKDIYIIHSYSGIIDLYDGLTLLKINSFETGIQYPLSLNMADIDNDGALEFILNKYVNDSQLLITVLDGKTYESKWDTTLTVGNNDEIKVGDVDDDGVNEIIISSGLVIDGLNHKIDWNYESGFGDKLKVGDLNNDGKAEIIGVLNYTKINVFDGKTKSSSWSLETDNEIESIYLYSDSSIAETEMIIGNSQWRSIDSYNPLTRELKWSIINPNSSTTNISIGDPDNDGEKELIWGAGVPTSAPDHLYIANIDKRYIEWISKDHISPFKIDILDKNNGGDNEIIIGCNKSDIMENSATIFSLNSSTYRTEHYKSYVVYKPQTMLVAKLKKQEQSKIITTIYNKMYVFNSENFNTDYLGTVNNSTTEIICSAYGDIDNDGVKEVVFGNESGNVFVLNGETFEEEWHSVRTNGPVIKIMLANCDQDSAMEIVLLNYSSEIEMYDGKSHIMDGQIKSLKEINNFDIEDINSDGNLEIICSNNKGRLYVLDSKNLTEIETLDLNVPDMIGLKIANLDSDSSMEIITGSSKLQVFNYEDLSQKFESSVLGINIGINDNIKVVDVDDDNHLDIFFNNDYGVYHFECSEVSPDLIPPTIISTYPIDQAKNVGINENIQIRFSENIYALSITDSNFTIVLNDSLVLQKTIEYNQDSKTVTIHADEIMLPNSNVKIICSANILDYFMNGLDGNVNGISEGQPVDNYSFSFETGISIDTIGPEIKNLIADKNELWPGTNLHISSEISDISNIATSKIGFVECFIDSIGSDSSGIKLKPIDGLINSPVENIYLDLKTNDWQKGEHSIYIFGYDELGNKSDTAEISIFVRTEDKKKANWPMRSQNAQNTGFNINDSIKTPLKLKWSRKIFENPVCQTIVVDDQVFLMENSTYNNSSKIYSLSLETGDTVWSYNNIIAYNFEFFVNAKSLSYQNGRLYIPIDSYPSGGLLLCIDALNGKYLWSRSTSTSMNNIGISPIISDNKVFIAWDYGNLLALDALKDSVLWSSGDNLYRYSWTPGYLNDKVYTCGSESTYKAYNIKSGKIEQHLGSYETGYTPVLSNGSVFTQNPVSEIDLNTNKVLWSVSGELAPAVAYDLVFIANSKSIYVHEVKTGLLEWTLDINEEITNPPIVSNGIIFLSTADKIFALDVKSQEKIWEFNEGGRITVANNNLFLSTDDGRILCFEEDKTTNVSQSYEMPKFFSLNQNYPNPFNPKTTIEYSIPKQELVTLKIFDVLGREMQTLVNEIKSPGSYNVEFDASNYSSGVYFYQMKAGNFNEIKKFILLK